MPRTLIMFVTTPIVGRLYNRVHPAVLIGIGIALVSLGSFDLSHLTRASGSSDIIGALLVTGVGFSCLFVPLAAVSLSTIPRPQYTDATGLNALFRQVGGSVGLTLFASVLTRFTTQARVGLVASVTALRPEVTAQLTAFQMAPAPRAFDPVSGHEVVVRLLGRTVEVQSTVLAYEKVFFLQAISFLAVLPLVFLLRRYQSRAQAEAALEIG